MKRILTLIVIVSMIVFAGVSVKAAIDDSSIGKPVTVKIDSTTNTVKMDGTTNTVKTTAYSTAITIASSSGATAAPVTQQTGRRYFELRVASSTAAAGTNEVWVNVGGPTPTVATVSSGLLVTPGDPLKLEIGTVGIAFISSTTVPISYTSITY